MNIPLPARKAKTGTSYTASGVNDPSIVQPQLEIEDGSSRPAIVRELVPELANPSIRIRTYARMMTDSGVDVSMRIAKTPVLGADFYVDPYDNQPVNEEIAQFIEANLFGGMSSPFSMSLEDIMHFLEDGYAVMEKVVELREWTAPGTNRNTRVYTMLKKLGVRPPTTLKPIIYDDNGGPFTISQTAIQGDNSTKDVDMNISKVMIFTFNRNGGDLTGKSLLRTAYPHWYYKNHFYKLDAIQKERHGIGVPYGKLLAGFTEETRKVLRTMLRNIRSNEEAFIIELPNVEIGFKELSGQPVDILESALHHNMMILMNVMAQFLVLGTASSSGSRATGGVQADIFMKALRYIANYICEVVNMYLIPELVVWNYPTKSYPKLKVRNIGETRDLQALAAAYANLFGQGQGLLTWSAETENFTRDVFDMPGIDPATAEKLRASINKSSPPPVPAVGNQGPQNQPGTPNTNGGTGKGTTGSNNGGQGNTPAPTNAP